MPTEAFARRARAKESLASRSGPTRRQGGSKIVHFADSGESSSMSAKHPSMALGGTFYNGSEGEAAYAS
jgi:hypothetical protein